MKADLVIQNAQIISPKGASFGSVAVRSGKIVAIAEDGNLPPADQVIDAEGRPVIPGVLDLHVHFRDPGLTHKEDFSTGSRAAAAGGVTTIFDMPNTHPPVLDVDGFQAKREIAEAKSYVNFGLYAFLQGNDLGRLERLIDAGVAGFKWAMTLAAEKWALPDEYYDLDNGAALAAFRTIQQFGYTVGVHAEDLAMIQRLTKELEVAGRSDFRAHLDSRPDYVEVIALERALRLAEISGCHLHVHHLSSKSGLELIKRRRSEGVSVTAEACPPWFLFHSGDYDQMRGLIRVTPAIKERWDAEALWQGLCDGSIECYATDHAPHSYEEKLERNWRETLPGANGVETSLPLLLDRVNKGLFSLPRLVAVACENPARISGLFPRKGTIQIGADADLVLIDMQKTWTIRNEELHSKNKLTPFHEWTVQGMPVLTIVSGQVVAKEREIVAEPGIGKLVNPKQDW